MSVASVSLHIYDITNSPDPKTNNTIVQVNKFMRDGIGLGGIFHGAIEVYGAEWSYGYCPSGSGVFRCPPKRNPMYTWRETVELGVTVFDESQVAVVVQNLSNQWMGSDYDLLQRNCNHFCDELSLKLGTGNIPGWVNRFANMGDAAAEFASASATQVQYVQASLYGVGKAAYRCFWSSPESSPPNQSGTEEPSAAERLFPRSSLLQRSDAKERSEGEMPQDGLRSWWSSWKREKSDDG